MIDLTPTLYKKEDFRSVSWEEYGIVLDEVYTKVRSYLKTEGLEVDAVVPILRGGNIAGTYLAYKLHLLKIMPVQYKYLVIDGQQELKNLGGASDDDFKDLNPKVLLVVENNHCFGNTAKLVVSHLKELLPETKVLYVGTYMDYSNQEMPGAEATFYGKLTNEARGLSQEEAKDKGVGNELSLFPWEDIEEEWASIQGQEFNYKL